MVLEVPSEKTPGSELWVDWFLSKDPSNIIKTIGFLFFCAAAGLTVTVNYGYIMIFPHHFCSSFSLVDNAFCYATFEAWLLGKSDCRSSFPINNCSKKGLLGKGLLPQNPPQGSLASTTLRSAWHFPRRPAPLRSAEGPLNLPGEIRWRQWQLDLDLELESWFLVQVQSELNPYQAGVNPYFHFHVSIFIHDL